MIANKEVGTTTSYYGRIFIVIGDVKNLDWESVYRYDLMDENKDADRLEAEIKTEDESKTQARAL